MGAVGERRRLAHRGRRPVDWILRDLDRVHAVWADCREGRYEVGTQPGHPLGFWSSRYPGQVALSRVLADPTGELTALRARMRTYPEPLRTALIEGSWEAGFLVAGAAESARKGDTPHVSPSLSRAFGVLAQNLHAHHRTWCLNEKGALAAAAELPHTPPGFADRVTAVLGACGGTAPELTATVARAAGLVAGVRVALVQRGGWPEWATGPGAAFRRAEIAATGSGGAA